jgi:hypothetical protein
MSQMAVNPEIPLITVGNAGEDQDRGWFVGQFVSPAGGLRSRDDIEIKWAVHPAGDVRARGWSLNRTATTIAILLEGSLVILFRGSGWERKVELVRKGDYVIFNPGVEHTWYSEVDSLVLTIRTPSVQDDQEHFNA